MGSFFRYMSQFIRVISTIDVYFLFNAREKEQKKMLSRFRTFIRDRINIGWKNGRAKKRHLS